MSAEEQRPGDFSQRASGTPGNPEAERQTLLHQLREANEQLVVSSMRAQGLADEAEASRDEFLASVSHQLRTPLNAVLGWARLLASGQIDAARTTDAIHIIERNATALARIIDDLLDTSRIIGGGVRIEAQPVDLVAVIQGAIDEIQPTAQANTARLTFTCHSVPDPVPGDAMRLQQVIANLLSNAIKFTPPGGQVAVTLTSVGSHAEIRVSDTGQGIEAEFLPRIFERFAQADTSTTRRHGGLGLGLAIVRALVERHGGTVQAQSAGQGQGATFTVRLPVLPGQKAGDAEGRGVLERPAAAGTPIRLDGIRVVLVEDDDDGRDVLTMILELAGANVVPARSVREALAVLDTLRPDVIVSDIGMPDEDGFMLIREVRAREARGAGSIPAIAVTGYVYPEHRARLLAAGFQTHLRKPVESAEIVAAVASLVAIRDR